MNFQNVNDTMSTLKQTKYNGRVDIENNRNVPFDLYQENGSISFLPFKNQAITHITTRNVLSDTFFSEENQNIIQNKLRYQVWLQTDKKHVIDKQSHTELQVIMRSIYFQFAQNRDTDIKEQIEELNRRVLEFAVPRVYSNLMQYIGYKRDISKLPEPLEHSMQVGMKGTKTLFMPNFF